MPADISLRGIEADRFQTLIRKSTKAWSETHALRVNMLKLILNVMSVNSLYEEAVKCRMVRLRNRVDAKI